MLYYYLNILEGELWMHFMLEAIHHVSFYYLFMAQALGGKKKYLVQNTIVPRKEKKEKVEKNSRILQGIKLVLFLKICGA